jgi:putative hydrolase of the HAD superfamily
MNIKAIMVDVDGVLVLHPDVKGWTVHLDRDLGISVETLQRRFFDVYWDDIVCGRATLRDRLGPVLEELWPRVSCEDLIDYWFANDAHVNLELVGALKRLRRQGIELHLATVQEHERALYLWETLDFQSHFDGMHYAAALGCAKPDPAFFKRIEDRTGLAPSDIFFIDDKAANVEAAQNVGWSAALWKPEIKLDDLLSNVV